MIDRTSWLQTYAIDANCDGAIDLFDPKPGQYTIEAIAHSLALTNRFRGMTREPYSVAQHCVLGARTFETPSSALAFLLHELDEVVLGDVLPGVKERLSVYLAFGDEEDFGVLAMLHEHAAVASLGLVVDGLHGAEVKECDMRMLATEKRDLLGKSPREWHLEVAPFDDKITPWHWAAAETAFLKTYRRLRRALGHTA